MVFTSGPDPLERAMVDEIVGGLDVVNLSGKISLMELAAVIEMSEMLVCVDSVPFHMASALKKRVVAIFGPTSDVTWGPWRNPEARVVAQNFSCRPCYQDGCGGSKMSDCLATLPVGMVLKAMDSFKREAVLYREPLGLANSGGPSERPIFERSLVGDIDAISPSSQSLKSGPL